MAGNNISVHKYDGIEGLDGLTYKEAKHKYGTWNFYRISPTGIKIMCDECEKFIVRGEYYASMTWRAGDGLHLPCAEISTTRKRDEAQATAEKLMLEHSITTGEKKNIESGLLSRLGKLRSEYNSLIQDIQSAIERQEKFEFSRFTRKYYEGRKLEILGGLDLSQLGELLDNLEDLGTIEVSDEQHERLMAERLVDEDDD